MSLPYKAELKHDQRTAMDEPQTKGPTGWPNPMVLQPKSSTVMAGHTGDEPLRRGGWICACDFSSEPTPKLVQLLPELCPPSSVPSTMPCPTVKPPRNPLEQPARCVRRSARRREPRPRRVPDWPLLRKAALRSLPGARFRSWRLQVRLLLP